MSLRGSSIVSIHLINPGAADREAIYCYKVFFLQSKLMRYQLKNRLHDFLWKWNVWRIPNSYWLNIELYRLYTLIDCGVIHT